jgi:diguanylate cyclase (GGDEF)-like protein
MELKAYLRTLASHWWVVLAVFVMTYAATLVQTFREPPVYQGRATYIVKLNSTYMNDKDLASAVDILSRRTEIATTYTIVANSRLIKRLAAEAIGLPRGERGGISVSSDLVPGTNVIQITVQAGNPELARDFANAVGEQLAGYTRGLYATYTLEQLDDANAPSAPIKPDIGLNLTLGAVMGLLLGIGVAFLAAYLRAPAESVAVAAVMDEETGLYGRRYFISRLRQELARSRRNRYPLGLALVDVDHRGVLADTPPEVRREGLRRSALLLAGQMRDEDLLAHYEGATFAVLLPDMAAEPAQAAVERIRSAIAAAPISLEHGDARLNLHASAGLVVYEDIDPADTATPEVMVGRAEEALRHARAVHYGKVEIAPEPAEEQAETREVGGVWRPKRAGAK